MRQLLFALAVFAWLQAPAFTAAADENVKGQAEWEKTLAAARKEGVVVISASSSEVLRQVLTAFEQDYPGIKVDYHSMNGRDFRARAEKEREVGQYLWDLRIGGTDATTYQWKSRGVLDPIKPLLVLPDVTENSKWIGGIDSLFGDKEKRYVLHFSSSLFGGVVADRDAVPEKDFKSAHDLIDPRWKGKIVMQDPRGGGSGNQALATFIMKYGEQFARDLLSKQDVVISDSKRQMAEWVVRKRYPIAVGLGSDDTLAQFQQQGLGKNVKNVSGDDAIGGDTVTLINKAPHPNAAKVYVNWLLSAKTQAKLADVAKFNSRRVDVKPGNPESALDPQRIGQYLSMSNEEAMEAKLKAQQLGKELLK
ncbi:MAG: extracellular solute-binding protein [Burkholderiales bacterium]|nr:extracellular solute-binding protein [Burkholderiales bacterium]